MKAMRLPFDLIRMSFMRERQELDAAAQERLVDEILLPAFTGRWIIIKRADFTIIW